MRPARSALFVSTLVLGIGLACSKPETAPVTPKVDAPKATVQETQTPVVKDDGIDKARLAEQERLAALRRAAEAALKDINFDFDKSDIREGDRATLAAVADWMKANPTFKVQIQGNCDERGTAEYNLALGNRRADAALHYLTTLGVAESRLSTISFGK